MKKAIVDAVRGGFLGSAGVASVRYSDFLLLRQKDKVESEYRLNEAIKYYEEWGADTCCRSSSTKDTLNEIGGKSCIYYKVIEAKFVYPY